MSPELQALVEKVARAISRNYIGSDWENIGEESREDLRADALAAIRAVAAATREATPEMLITVGPGTTFERPIDLAPVYRAMHAASVLGEALNDG